MSRHSPRWVRVLNLGGLIVLGLVAGYLLMAGWRQAAPDTAAPPAAVPGAPSTTPPAGAPESPAGASAPPPPTGSSQTVVGGLSPEELARIQAGDSLGEATAPPTVTGAPLAPGEIAAASRFPPTVQEAARRYRCLCGCGHDLASCPCNDQPIGAVTMLTSLQKLLDQGLAGEAADRAMVDRYGDHVLVAAPPAGSDSD